MSEFITVDGNNLTEASHLYNEGAGIDAIARAILASRQLERNQSLTALGDEATLCKMSRPTLQDTGVTKTDDRGRPYKQVKVLGYDWDDCASESCWTSTQWGPSYAQHREDALKKASNPPGSTYYTRVRE